jgi:hypothetical protein
MATLQPSPAAIAVLDAPLPALRRHPPGDTPDPDIQRAQPAAHPPRSGPPDRTGTVRGTKTAATAAGLGRCRPSRSADRFLT